MESYVKLTSFCVHVDNFELFEKKQETAALEECLMKQPTSTPKKKFSILPKELVHIICHFTWDISRLSHDYSEVR